MTDLEGRVDLAILIVEWVFLHGNAAGVLQKLRQRVSGGLG